MHASHVSLIVCLLRVRTCSSTTAMCEQSSNEQVYGKEKAVHFSSSPCLQAYVIRVPGAHCLSHGPTKTIPQPLMCKSDHG